MSKRPDWDKIHREDKVLKKGATPVGGESCEPHLELQTDKPGALHLEDQKMILKWTLKHLVFICEKRRCRPYSDLGTFIELNPTTAQSAETQREYERIQKIVNGDFDQLVASMALSKTDNFQRAFISLAKTKQSQGRAIQSRPELL